MNLATHLLLFRASHYKDYSVIYHHSEYQARANQQSWVTKSYAGFQATFSSAMLYTILYTMQIHTNTCIVQWQERVGLINCFRLVMGLHIANQQKRLNKLGRIKIIITKHY